MDCICLFTATMAMLYELADMQSDLEDELDDEDLTTEERAEIIDGYQPDIDEIKERIADLNEELENI